MMRRSSMPESLRCISLPSLIESDLCERETESKKTGGGGGWGG